MLHVACGSTKSYRFSIDVVLCCVHLQVSVVVNTASKDKTQVCFYLHNF